MKYRYGLVLLMALVGSAHAVQWTEIMTPYPHATTKVQCNHWGWVEPLWSIQWANPCTPLQVFVDGKVFTVADTTNACPDGKAAVYGYDYGAGDKDIAFRVCADRRK